MKREEDLQENDWYEKILEKPVSYRKKMAFLLTALLGFLIVAIWLFVTSYQIKRIFKDDEPTEKQTKSQPVIPTNPPESLQEKNEIFKK